LGLGPFKWPTASSNVALISPSSALILFPFKRLEQLIEALLLEFNMTGSSAVMWLHNTLNAPTPF
jgi:hypothetical protein